VQRSANKPIVRHVKLLESLTNNMTYVTTNCLLSFPTPCHLMHAVQITRNMLHTAISNLSSSDIPLSWNAPL